jgi:glycerol-3-phosphate dehydrogenase
VHTGTRVTAITPDGRVTVDGSCQAYDDVVNVAGPWAKQLLDESGVPARHGLDLIRGSHLLLNEPRSGAFLLQHPADGRICFVLPYLGKTLVGSTEVRQSLSEPIRCSAEEKKYLQEMFHYYLPASNASVCGDFAGLRPLIASHSRTNPSKVTREYAIEREGRILSVFGGKWTTSRVLGLRVAEAAVNAR